MSADHTPEPARPRRRGLTAASVALAVLLAGGGGAYWAAGGTGDGASPEAARDGSARRPAPLVLDGYGAPAAAPAERGIAPGEPAPDGGPLYKAAGPLPEGPETAPAYRSVADVDRRAVAALAEALEVPGTVREEDGAWTAGGGDRGQGRSLRVDSATGAWTFTAAVPLRAGGVSEEEARRAAEPVVEALGLEGAAMDAGTERDGLRIVRVDPRQDGLPVHGRTTEVGVGHGGALAGGSGRLAGLERTDGKAEYPVVDAARALAALNGRSGRTGPQVLCAEPAEGKPGPGRPEPARPGADGPDAVPPADGDPGVPGGAGSPEPCGPGGGRGTLEVTGAEFGLSAYRSQGRDLLVPSWLFEVAGPDGRQRTVAHPAVEPEYLAPSSPGDGDGDDASTSSPAEPGGPSAGRPVRTATHVDEYGEGDRTLTVHFWGGVCDDHTATAEESGESVTVRITGKPRDPDGVCVMIAEEMTAEVELDRPVGDRRLLDEEGEPLPEGRPAEGAGGAGKDGSPGAGAE